MENELTTVIKGMQLRSRFFFAPINTGLAFEGNPRKELINFHGLRSNNYTGINYVGNVAIDIDKITNANTLYINPSMSGYRELSNAIEINGSLPGVQIACFNSTYLPQKNWKNTKADEYINWIRTELKQITKEQIDQIVKSFQIGITKLYTLGFKAIQIHGAHGYFLNNFLSKTFNSRTDEYGKDNNLIIKEILGGLSAELKANVVIDLRVSLFETAFEENLDNERYSFLESLYDIPEIDIVSISNGIYNLDKKLIYPSKKNNFSGIYGGFIDFFKSHSNKIWNLSGNVRDVIKLTKIENNITFSVGRPIIADPDFLIKQFTGRENEVNECVYKNSCHYYSLNKDFIECGVNSKLF